MHNLDQILTYLAGVILLIAVIITLLSMVIRSNIFVRLVALEVFANILTASIALWAHHVRSILLIDVCLALALIIFISTIAYCQYIKGKQQNA